MSISAKELAAKLGISAATISMVMNNKPGISETTRERVLSAAAEYGYINKKNNVQTPSSVIQLITFKKHEKVLTDTPFFAQLTEGITQECLKQDCVLHISYIQDSGNIQQQMDQIRSINCAGILLLGTEMLAEDFVWFENMNVPVIVLDCYYETISFDCVLINNVHGAFNACRHLIKSGHTRIGHLGSKVYISNFDERRAGYKKALEVYHIDYHPEDEWFISPTASEGYVDMKNFLQKGSPTCDCYFADNDIIAAAAMRAFREQGYRIPEDISIIGFDDMPLCDMMVPPLSTMQVDKKLFGQTAVKRLIECIEEKPTSHFKTEINTSLIKRESVSVK